MKVIFLALLAIIVVPLIFSFFQSKKYEAELKSEVSSKVSEVFAKEGLEGMEFELDRLDVVVSGSVDAEDFEKVKAVKEGINEIGGGEVRASDDRFKITVNGDLKVAKEGNSLVLSGYGNSVDDLKGHLSDGLPDLSFGESDGLKKDDLYVDSPVLSSVELKDWSNQFLKLPGDRGFSVSAKDNVVRPFGKVTPDLQAKLAKLAKGAELEMDASGFEVIEPTPAKFQLTKEGAAVSLNGTGPMGFNAGQFYETDKVNVAEDAFVKVHPSIDDPKFAEWMKGYFGAKGKKGLEITDDQVTMTGLATPGLQRAWMGQLSSLGAKPSSKLSLYPSEFHYPGYQRESDLDPDKLKTLMDAFALNQIFFDSGDSSIREDQLPKVDALEQAIKAAGDEINFIIGGHADATGNWELNQQLSQKRAKSVVAALAEKEILNSRFTVVSFGAAEASNAGGSENDRKVEILIK